MGSRMVMMSDVHIFGCIDVGGSNNGYMSYPNLCGGSTVLFICYFNSTSYPDLGWTLLGFEESF